MNQNAYPPPNRDMVNAGLGSESPAILKDRRVASPHAIPGIDVDQPNAKPKRRTKTAAPAPAVPDDVIREVRIGSTIALLLAAGISARTLFQLGEIIGLPASFAWMLPGAFDVYAYVSARVASRIPEAHRARKWAVWNARIALSFTMIGNSLVHALFLMSHGKSWTATDYALTAVSAIPPIIVERLLHLQTKIAADGAGTAAGADSDASVPTRKNTAAAPTTSRTADAAPPTVPTPVPTATPVGTRSTDRPRTDGADVIDMRAAGDAVRRPLPEWVALALPLYREHLREYGEGPNAPRLAALLDEAGHGAPGKSRARDVRAATEKAAEEDPKTAEAVNR